MVNGIDKKYTQYAEDVLQGNIVANTYIRQACERYLSYFDKYDFHAEKVDKVVNFIAHLKHYTGQHNKKPFILLPYQFWVICAIFGFYHKGTDKRVTNYVYFEVARKNGKTAFFAAIQLYMLIGDGENGAEVELVANSAKQATIAFTMCSKFLGSIDPKNKYFKRYRDSIRFDKASSVLQVLSSDASGNDGYNSYCFLLDEAHEQADSRLWDVMISSQGMRKNPLAMIATTAGFNKFGFCYSYRKTCIDILSGVATDDSQFCAIYTLDEDDKWDDESAWIKANPSLGVTVQEDYLRGQIVKAKNNTSLEVGVRTKNLNEWVSSQDIWISNDALLEVTQDLDMKKKFKDKDIVGAYVGVDLAAVGDLTAVAYLIPYKDKLYFKTDYYLPSSCLANNSNCELYKKWVKQGLLKVTPGNVTDYDYITTDLLKFSESVPIQKIAYDSYNATQWAVDAQEKGLPLEAYAQTLWNFNVPTKAMERIIKNKQIVIDNNEVTRWCFSNVVLKYDHNDNCLDINTEVPTTEGFKKIKDISVGDYVFGSDGKPVKVIGETDIHHNRECYKIQFYNGAEVICDETHQWKIWVESCKKSKIYKKWDKRDTKWIYDHRSKLSMHPVPQAQPVEYSEKEFKIDPYLLGQWLGDGSSSGSNFACELKDIHIYDNYDITIRGEERYKDSNTREFYVKNGLRTQLRELGLLNNKHIPEEYFQGSYEQRLSLLHGIMDTDGTCNKAGQCSITQKKYDIAFGVHRILNSLGIRHTFYKDKRGYWMIQFYTTMRVFRLERKYQRQLLFEPKGRRQYNNPIINIEKVESVPTKCITVDNEDHTFLITKDYVVTSNCKPIKEDYQQKIDGVIAMIQALGSYIILPQYDNSIDF